MAQGNAPRKKVPVKGEERRIYDRARYAAKKTKGLCGWCSKKAVKGKSLCKTDLRKNNENVKRFRAKRKAQAV